MTMTPDQSCDLAAEQAVLGSMMQSATVLGCCLERLRPSDFWRPAHQVIFEGMASLDAAGLPVDPVLLQERLAANPAEKYGGAPYLHDLLASVPATSMAMHYADIVVDKASRRHLASAAVQIGQVAASTDLDAGQRQEQAARFLDAAAGRASQDEPQLLGSLLPSFLEQLDEGPESVPGVETGWADLRRLLPRLRPGELMTVGGRPGTGKTAVLLGMAARAAVRDGVPVLLVSLEMTATEIVQRLVAAAARVPLADLRERRVSAAQFAKIRDAYGRLADAPLLISDDPYPRVAEIRGWLRGMRRRGRPAGLLSVDYLQLMSTISKPESRQLEVSEINRGLKLTAKEFDCPVVVGSQLNRNPEARADKRPMLGDLRESGSSEQDSDVVLLLYRDKVYHPHSAEASGVLEVSVAKQRNGPTGVVMLAFREPFAEVADLAGRPADPPPPPQRRPTRPPSPPTPGSADMRLKDP